MPLKNYQHQSILREYDAKRLKNHYIEELRKKEVYEAIPALQEIDNEIASGSVASAKAALRGDNNAIHGLKERNEALSAKKRELMLSHGFPADYLNPIYDCTDCRDTGYIGTEKCHCFKQAVVRLLYAQSNIEKKLEDENFEHFCTDYYPDECIDDSQETTPYRNIITILKEAREFVRDFDTVGGNLLYYGNTGVGKTFLSNCIAGELLNSGHTVIYLTASQLFDVLEQLKFGRRDSYQSEDYNEVSDRFGYILDCDLLIIDDLGTELSNTFTNSQLYRCLDERILNGRSTIISTNLSLQQLRSTYSERIFSRMASNYKFNKIVCEDIRIQKKFR